MPVNFDILIKSKKWLDFANDSNSLTDNIESICRNVIDLCPIQKLNPVSNNIELSLILMSDQQIKKINNKYRQKITPPTPFHFQYLTKMSWKK